MSVAWSAKMFCGGSVAQWLEQTAHNRLVLGSSPSGPTKIADNRLALQTTDFDLLSARCSSSVSGWK